MVRSHTKSYIHTPAVKNVIKNSVSWTTESRFAKMLVNVLFLDIMRVVNSFVALVCGVRIMLWLLYLWRGKEALVPICQESGGWVSKLIWMWWWRSLRVLGIEPGCQSIRQLNYRCSVYCANNWQKHVVWLTLVHWFCIKFVWLITLPALNGVPDKCHSESYHNAKLVVPSYQVWCSTSDTAYDTVQRRYCTV